MNSFMQIWIADRNLDYEKKKYELLAYLKRFDDCPRDQQEQIRILKKEIEEIDFIKMEKLLNRNSQELLSLANIVLKHFALNLLRKHIKFYNVHKSQIDQEFFSKF